MVNHILHECVRLLRGVLWSALLNLKVVEPTSVLQWRALRSLYLFLLWRLLYCFLSRVAPIIQKALPFKEILGSLGLLHRKDGLSLLETFLLHHGDQLDQLGSLDLFRVEVVGLRHVQITDDLLDRFRLKHIDVQQDLVEKLIV